MAWSVKFRINAGNNSGACLYRVNICGGFNWTSGSPYAICTAAATPNPQCPAAEVANQEDWFGCDVVGTTSASTRWACWAPQYNMTAPSSLSVVNSASCAGVSSAACTTSATNMTGANLIVACLSYYNPDGASTLSDSQSNSYTQVYSTTQNTITGILYFAYAPTVTSTMTFTANGAAAPGLAVMGFSGAVSSPLDQSTNPAATATASTLAPGSLTPGQANELLATCLSDGLETTVTVASPFTLGPVVNTNYSNNVGIAMAYQIQAPGPTAENPLWTSGAGSADLVAGMATFK